MNNFLKRIVFFSFYILMIVFLLECLLIKLSSRTDRYAWQFEELNNPKLDADIVIFGSSKSVRGINPKELEDENIRVFNFALNGSNPEYLYNWYHYLFRNNYNKPKLIILEVSWLMFNNEWMWRDIEQDSKYFTLKNFISMSPQVNNKKSLLINKFHFVNMDANFIKSLISTSSNSLKGENISLSYNGYTPFLGSQSSKKYSDSIYFKHQNQHEYFKKLLNALEKDGSRVIMVNLPENIDKEFSKSKIVVSNLSFIKSESQKRGIPLIDYQKENIPDSLFYNWNHLNITGANLITHKLRKDIKARTHNTVYTK